MNSKSTGSHPGYFGPDQIHGQLEKAKALIKWSQEGMQYLYQLDGYRAVAVKADGRVSLFSRRRKSFDHHYPLIVEALGELPEGMVVDGEVVALDESGRPNFNLLQNFRERAKPYGHLTRLILRKNRRGFFQPAVTNRVWPEAL